MRIFAPLLAALFFVAGTALAGPTCVTKDGWYFSLSEKTQELAVHFAVQGDKAAFDRLISSGLLRPLKGGVSVYIEPGGSFGLTAIRLPGSLNHVWVPNEAIRCK